MKDCKELVKEYKKAANRSDYRDLRSESWPEQEEAKIKPIKKKKKKKKSSKEESDPEQRSEKKSNIPPARHRIQ